MEQLSGRGPGVQLGQFLILLAIIVGAILAGSVPPLVRYGVLGAVIVALVARWLRRRARRPSVEDALQRRD